VDLIRDIDKGDRASVTDYLVRHPSGVWVLPAPRESLLWRSVTPDMFRRVIDVIRRRFDIVLIDTAAMLSDLSLMVLDESNVVLWVTSTDFSSINNSLQGLDALQGMKYPEGRIRLVLNVTSSDDGVRPARIEEVLKRQFFWKVPYDRQLRAGAQVGNPAVLGAPDSIGAKTLIDLAKALTGATEVEIKSRSGIGKLFRRKSSGPEFTTNPEVATNSEGG
jgi:pilus assembly protein CpaE